MYMSLQRVEKDFMRERSKRVSPSDHVIFFLLHKILSIHNNVLGNFLKISDHFPKILEKLSEGQTYVSEHFPKISKDYQRLPKKTRRLLDHTPTN